MSGYAGQEPEGIISQDAVCIGLRPDPAFEHKLLFAAEAVGLGSTLRNKLELAGVAGLDISFAPLRRSIYELEDGKVPYGFDRLDLISKIVQSDKDEDTTRAIAYAAYIGVGPEYQRPSIVLNPFYDRDPHVMKGYELQLENSGAGSFNID